MVAFFFKGTHPCQHNNSEAIQNTDKRSSVSCSQVNLSYGKLFVFFQVNRFTGNLFLNREFMSSNLNRLNFFSPILIEMYFFLVIIGLYMAKYENNKIFVRLIPENKYFSKIPMFCFRKTGNFKALLPVN
jgi:hypothetical protein